MNKQASQNVTLLGTAANQIYDKFNQMSNMVSSFAGPVSLLTLWTNRITQANSRKHQEFAGRLSSVNNKAELYQHLKEENGCVDFTVSLSVPCYHINQSVFVLTLFSLLGWMFKRMEKPPDDVWNTPLLISAGSLIY